MLDVNGIVATWNAGAAADQGLPRRRDHRPALLELLSRRRVRKRLARARAAGRDAEGRFEDEGWRVRKDGSRFWANVIITALRDDAGRLRGFAKLTRDLTERKRAEALEVERRRARGDARGRAQRAHARLSAATRIKDEFLATLSHELRTPLNAILGWTQLLRTPRAPRAGGAQTAAIEIIERNARAQVQLIDDLLDLSRIMSGQASARRPAGLPGRRRAQRASIPSSRLPTRRASGWKAFSIRAAAGRRAIRRACSRSSGTC